MRDRQYIVILSADNTHIIVVISYIAQHYCVYFVGDEEEEDEDLIEFREQITEIDQEEFVDEEEDEEEESKTEAIDRIKTSITEKFEEIMETISNIQVSNHGTISTIMTFVCNDGHQHSLSLEKKRPLATSIVVLLKKKREGKKLL